MYLFSECTKKVLTLSCDCWRWCNFFRIYMPNRKSHQVGWYSLEFASKWIPKCQWFPGCSSVLSTINLSTRIDKHWERERETSDQGPSTLLLRSAVDFRVYNISSMSSSIKEAVSTFWALHWIYLMAVLLFASVCTHHSLVASNSLRTVVGCCWPLCWLEKKISSSCLVRN